VTSKIFAHRSTSIARGIRLDVGKRAKTVSHALPLELALEFVDSHDELWGFLPQAVLLTEEKMR